MTLSSWYKILWNLAHFLQHDVDDDDDDNDDNDNDDNDHNNDNEASNHPANLQSIILTVIRAKQHILKCWAQFGLGKIYLQISWLHSQLRDLVGIV